MVSKFNVPEVSQYDACSKEIQLIFALLPCYSKFYIIGNKDIDTALTYD
jgi:hypothetical protein